ncbi:MAG: hypothetical protein M3468_07730 [Acidobacteriota bacterium]|nr:hypothetical protein [Acidobacteriota bacterium]
MFGSDRDGRMAFYEKTVSTGSGDRKVVEFDDISPALFGWSTAFPTVVALDLAPSGNRFLALVPERDGVGAVTVVQFWRSALPDSKR